MPGSEYEKVLDIAADRYAYVTTSQAAERDIRVVLVNGLLVAALLFTGRRLDSGARPGIWGAHTSPSAHGS